MKSFVLFLPLSFFACTSPCLFCFVFFNPVCHLIQKVSISEVPWHGDPIIGKVYIGAWSVTPFSLAVVPLDSRFPVRQNTSTPDNRLYLLGALATKHCRGNKFLFVPRRFVSDHH